MVPVAPAGEHPMFPAESPTSTREKVSLLGYSRMLINYVNYALSQRIFGLSAGHGRVLNSNDAQIKTRKTWSEGASLFFAYYLQTDVGFLSTVSLTKTEKKREDNDPSIWQSRVGGSVTAGVGCMTDWHQPESHM